MIKLFIYLQLLDLLTTVICLRQAGGYEANPILARMMSVLGVVGALLVTKLLIVGVIMIAAKYGRTWAAAKGAYIYACVVGWNLCMILLNQRAVS